jgi:hypothetical protein
MLLAPISANASAVDQADAQREAMEQATEEPQATEEALPEETEEALPEETEEPINELLGAIEIDYWECNPGFDITNPDLENLFQDCQGVDNIGFFVNTSDGGQQTQQTGEFGDAHVSFTELPTGQTSFGQSNPDGRPIAVYCNGIVQHGGPETGIQNLSVFNGAVQWDLQDDEIVFCSWLVGTPAEPADLIVHKWLCPEGYDPQEDSIDPTEDCTEAMDGVTFIVTDEDPNTSDIQTDTGDSIDGAVMFGGLAPGDYTITETLPDGIESAFLWNCETDPPQLSLAEEPWNEGPEWSFTMAGQDVECQWFNVPGEGGLTTEQATETATEEATETATEEPSGDSNSVTVYKWECPAGTGYGMAIDDYSAACDTEHLNIPISLTDDNGEHATTTQANGTEWDDVVPVDGNPDDAVFLAEEIPDGFGEPVVFCQALDQDEWRLYESEDGAFTLDDFGADTPWTVQCNWYNVPTDGGTPFAGEGYSVTVYKWLCPAGTAYGQSIDDYSAACDTEHLDIPITLTDASGDRPATTQANGTEWDNVTSGDQSFAITETIPEGFGSPVVFCRPVDADEAPLIPVTEGTVLINDFQSDYQCFWYNIPLEEGFGSVAINKHACPAGIDAYSLDIYELAAQCHEDPGSVDFTVTSGAYNETVAATGGGNYASFTQVPSGTVTVTEDLPDGYGTPIVYCKVEVELDLSDIVPTYLESVGDGPAISAPLGNGQLLWCDWYNVPETGSTITITKWYCPEGTTYDHEDIWYQENCTQVHEGVDFRLAHSEGESLKTTDGSGVVEWTDVPLGPWSIQEYIPVDYAEPVVICGFSAYANGAIVDGFPQRVEAPTGYFEWEFEYPQTQYFCNWYNIPGGPAELTIYKYTCEPGYDLYAWGADPGTDCDEGPNGITFTTDGPNGYHSQTDTGDSVPYAVYFGGLAPGSYTITETVPADTADVFVLDCYGQHMGELRPYPLDTDNELTIDVSAGEFIECRWFNVPEDPGGRLTVYKHVCSTKVYVSEVDCEIYEGGQDFDLVRWDGDSWGKVDDGTTDGGGLLTWGGIEPGEYWLDEQGGEWCHLTSEDLSDDGNWLNVYDGKETVVHVYNCTGEPGKPGGKPTKYPNTGVPPVREEWRLEP